MQYTYENNKLSAHVVSVSEFRIRCVCHAINNVAEVGIEDDQKIVSRVREMVKAARRPKARKQYIALRESGKEESEKDKHLRLSLDVATRWNSTLPMLREAFEARLHLKKYATVHGSTVFKKNLLTDFEWADVRRLAEFLEPLDQATNDCSAGDTPTFNLGKQCLSTLHQHFKVELICRQKKKCPNTLYW